MEENGEMKENCVEMREATDGMDDESMEEMKEAGGGLAAKPLEFMQAIAPSSAVMATQPKFTTISLKSKNSDRSQRSFVQEKEQDGDDAKNFANQLLIMLSNMYLNAPYRLRMSFLLRCARDLSHCHKNHYRSPMPEAPNHSQALALRCALQQERYLTFVNSATDMCLRKEFPGDGVFAKLIELVLSINPEKDVNPRMTSGLRKAIELFYLLVRTFPPCWLELRQYYLRFFKNPLDKSKISTKHSSSYTKSDDVFNIILDLLEHTLNYYNEDGEANANMSLSQESEPRKITDFSSPQMHKLCFNQYDYEQQENRANTFAAMSASLRLERIFTVLRLILQILEHDFVMWIWHHHKKGRDWIFGSTESPLSISIMEMSLTVRLSRVTERVFKIFSSMVRKGIKEYYVNTVERYIALIMLASNIADIDVTVHGIEFPYLGSDTARLISNFYSIFKEHNTTNFENYIKTANILTLPFVRYEFIHNFLQSFGFSNEDEFKPHKVLMDIMKKRWKTFLPNSRRGSGDNNNNKNLDNGENSDEEFINSAHRIDDEDEDDLSREQYLNLLLEALKAYCDWYGLHGILRFITLDERMRPLKTITDSVHRWPTRGSTDDVLLLTKMTKDIVQLEGQVRMNARITPPRVDLAQAEILIDNDILQRYRSDLKYCFLTSSEIAKQSRLFPTVDFSEWTKFLKQFQRAEH